MGREIGAGSFAKVYLGHTIDVPSRTVAIKSVLRSRLTKKLLENLESEISILKGIRHPHIVTLIDITNTGSHIHLIMEYCPLGDLSFFIKKRDKLLQAGQIPSQFPNVPGAGLNETLVRHFLIQLASALQFLRSKNLMHRDVKPQNLLLHPPGGELIDAEQNAAANLPILKLADFGFARYLQSASLAETLCGSPLYMAPEILRYEKYDASADLWSVGTVLYEMLVGKPPFRAANHVELLRRIDSGNDEIKFPSNILFDDEIKVLVRALLKRNPKERIDFNSFFAHPILHQQPLLGIVIPDPPSSFRKSLRSPEQVSDKAYNENTAGDAESNLLFPAFITDLIPKNTPPVPGPLLVPTSRGNPKEQMNDAREHRSEKASVSQPRHRALPLDSEYRATGDLATPVGSPGLRSGLVSATKANQDNGKEEASSGSSSPRVRLSKTTKMQDKDRDSEGEYVLVEKKTVEVNAFADAMARSPRLGNRLRRPSSLALRGPSPNCTAEVGGVIQAPNASTVHTLAMAECRLGSSPASALAKALSIASQKLFGGGSPPSWLENMVHNAVRVTSLSKGSGRADLGGLWSGIDECLSPDEEKFFSSLEAIAIRSNVVYDFAELKLRQLIPPPPSQSVDDLASLLTNEAIVSLCEEAIVLYLKTLQLLQKNIDLVQVWLMRDVHSGANSKLNHVVQWTRDRYNEVLEKAEYLQQKKVTTFGTVSQGHPFEEVTAEKLLYDRALEMSRNAAVSEIVGESLSHCEDDYEVSILMLEAILEESSKGVRFTGVAGQQAIEEEDRKAIEKWARLTRTRLDKLRIKIDQVGRFLR